MTTMTTMAIDRDRLVQRLFHASVGSLELFGVYLGQRLGLYSALAEHADLSATELADAVGVDARYVGEWLDQQAGAGYLVVAFADAGGEGDGDRRFALPAPHREVLAEPENPAFVAPVPLMVAATSRRTGT